MVHEKSTGDVYAMKVMKKSHILQQADVSCTMWWGRDGGDIGRHGQPFSVNGFVHSYVR